MNPTISSRTALARLNALRRYYKKTCKFQFSDAEFLNFVKNNHISELDRIRLSKNRGNVELSDLWVSRNSTRIKRRRNAE